MRQLLAVIAALLMVGAALLGRSAIDDDNDKNGNGNDGGTPTLLCAAELGDICDQLARGEDVEIILEPAGVTARTLATLPDEDRRKLGYDGWLTFASQADIVLEARERTGLAPVVEAPEEALGRTPLVVAMWKDRAQVLAPQCGGEVTVRCLGHNAGSSWSSIGGEVGWGTVKPGHTDPETTGEGLAVIGQEAAWYYDRSNLSRDDYEDDGFLDYFERFEDAVMSATRGGGSGVGDDSALARMLAAGPAAFDAVLTVEADAGPRLATAARRSDVDLIYPSPVATLDVVFAPIVGRGDDVEDVATGDSARAALANGGFRVRGEDRTRGIPASPHLTTKSNLPSAGSLEALLQTWREVTG